MASPADVVSEQFSNAVSYANSALDNVTTFTNALANAIYAEPTISVTWAAIDAPTAITIPDPPAQLDDLQAQMVWDQDGSIADSKPGPLTVAAPTIAIDDFTTAAPDLDLPDAPSLDFGTAPVLDFGIKPVGPVLDDITLPDAPVVSLPSTPSYLALTTPTFSGLNLHADLQDELADVPTLTLASPTPFTYSPGPQYASQLLSTLKTILNQRMGGGTGLNPVVEQAIWDRERSRETALGAKNEAEVLRTHEALGFHLPSGALAAQLRAAQQDTVDKIATASRDVAIKQAELEQQNLKDTIAAGIELEGKLVDYSFNLEQLAFNTAKEVADNAIAVHNAGVEQYRALLDRLRTLAASYQAIIAAEQLNMDEYKALLQAEQTKADVNRTLVEQYRAQIDAEIALIRMFEAQLGAAKVQVEIEQARVASFGEEVRAYVAGVNAQTAITETYKVGVEAQKIKADVTETLTRAQLARVEVFRAQTAAFAAKASAQGDKARAQVSYYEGVVRAKQAEWEGWSARVRGEAERFRALTELSGAVLDSFKAKAEVSLKRADQDIRRWEIGIRQYEAQANYTIAAAKINTDIVQANRQATLDAAKAGAAVYAQLTGSALGMIHTSAGVSASASDSVTYAYSNDTDSTVPPVTAV